MKIKIQLKGPCVFLCRTCGVKAGAEVYEDRCSVCDPLSTALSYNFECTNCGRPSRTELCNICTVKKKALDDWEQWKGAVEGFATWEDAKEFLELPTPKILVEPTGRKFR